MPHTRLRSWHSLVAGSAGLLALTSCGGTGGSAGAQQSPSPESAPGAVSGPITVFAAASLTDAFNEIKGFEALKLSVVCATAATVVCLVVGVPLAWLLARSDLPGKKFIRALVTVPMVLPPVVGGVALLIVLGRNGLIGQYLNAWFGISLPFTTAGVIVAEAFVAMPFLVISVDGA